MFIILLYIVLRYSDIYFEEFEEMRKLEIKKWRQACFIFSLADFFAGLIAICLFAHT